MKKVNIISKTSWMQLSCDAYSKFMNNPGNIINSWLAFYLWQTFRYNLFTAHWLIGTDYKTVIHLFGLKTWYELPVLDSVSLTGQAILSLWWNHPCLETSINLVDCRQCVDIKICIWVKFLTLTNFGLVFKSSMAVMPIYSELLRSFWCMGTLFWHLKRKV